MTRSTSQITIYPLLAVNFVGTLGLTIVTPFLVVIVVQWGGNALIYGILVATYSAFQIVGSSVLGKASDRLGRRRVLFYSQLGTLLSWGIFLVAFAVPVTNLVAVNNNWIGEFALTLPLVILFIARAADGLTGGNVSVSNAYLSDISTDDDRAKNFGRMAVSGNIGYIVGPALAGVLGATIFGAILPVVAAIVISALALALIVFGLPDVKASKIASRVEETSACEVLSHENKSAYSIACEKPDGIRALLAMPNMIVLMTVNFMVMLAFNVYYVVFPVHALQGLNWDVSQIGIYFAALSFFMIMAQGPALSYATRYISDRVLMLTGGVVLALGFVLLAFPQTWAVYLSAVLVAAGNGFMWPTFMSVLSKSGGSRMQGAIQGYAQSIGAVASIVGLVLGGLLYLRFGALLFAGAAVAILVSASMVAIYRETQPTNSPTQST